MQKQSFQRFPIRYRPYDFPARFPVLAFLGENWTISVDSPEYLHFHNGLEIGHCIRGNGQVFMTGRSPSVYETGTFSILFPQVPHMAVCGTQESQWEYIYIDPIRFLESAADCGSDIWQIFYMLQEIPVIIQEDTFPLLFYFLSRIFQEFHEKSLCISRLSMVFCSLCFLKSTVSLWRLRRGIQRNQRMGIPISAMPLPLYMGIMRKLFPYGSWPPTAVSAKAICGGCLKTWW